MGFLVKTKQNLFAHKLLYEHHGYSLELGRISDNTISKAENPLDTIHHPVDPIEDHRDECPDREEDDREDHIEDVECVEHM